MKRIFLAITALIVFCAAAVAQTPVKWRVNARMTSSTTGVVTVKATIDDGWHLYSTEDDAGPKPTKFDLSKSQGVKFTGALKPSVKAKREKDPNFGDTKFWEGSVTFTAPFKLTGSRANAKIAGTVNFMTCNGENCMPPKTVQLNCNVLPAKGKKK